MTNQQPIPDVPTELLQHLCQSSTLTPQEVQRLVAEILHFYGQTSDEFIRQRHQELQKSGRSNTEIYQTLEQETASRLFRANPLSIRQIRRAIYG